MLAGNHQDNEELVYSEPYSHLPLFNHNNFTTNHSGGSDTNDDSGEESTSGPSNESRSSGTKTTKSLTRGSHTRAARKDSGTGSKYVPLSSDDSSKTNREMEGVPGTFSVPGLEHFSDTDGGRGSLELQLKPTTVSENNNLTGDGNSFSDGSQTEYDDDVAKKISLGDYALPPDKMVDRLKGIPTCSTEYTEPYETQRLMKALRKESGSSNLRISSPARIQDTEVYCLAKQVPDHRSENNSSKFRDRSQSDISNKSHIYHRSISHIEKPKSVDLEDYDHLDTWTTKKALNSPKSPEVKSPKSPSGIVHSSQYEDPWDSNEKLRKFHDICEKAETAANRKSSQSSPNYTDKDKPRMDVYEDAWDSGFRQQKLEKQVEEAHRRISESNIVRQKYDYEEPISSEWKRDKPAALQRGSLSSRAQQRQATIIDSSEPTYTSNYEAPWDSKQKEKELEERLSRVGGLGSKSLRVDLPKSPSSISPPQFSPPPPPQTYEEAWDMRPQSKVISKMTGGHSSPDHRPNSTQGSPGHLPGYVMLNEPRGEVIDPLLPLDIQKFYHGGISRKSAEDLLLIHKEGSYLVRRSETQKNVFSLTLKGVGGMAMHLRISLSHGEYVLGENSQPFPTVPEMIDYYSRHPLPVQDANHIKLLHPIPRS